MPTQGLSRRHFLGALLSGALAVACEGRRAGMRVGLALGGGGARGLAHVPMIETLDELGIRPHRIAGTSIGAVMGVLSASGLKGAEIRGIFDNLVVTEKDTWRDVIEKKDLLRWLDFFDPEVGGGALISAESFVKFIEEHVVQTRFEALEIPLQVVAADLWTGEQVVFDSGPVMPAIEASIAVPGLFTPVSYQGRILVDGGVANPVPYDLLFDDCDRVIAIDVLGQRVREEPDELSVMDVVFAASSSTQKVLLAERLKQRPPDILIQPDIVGIRVLDFFRSDEIYRQAAPAQQELRRRLQGWT